MTFTPDVAFDARTRRRLGALAALGGVLFVIVTAGESLLPAPDSYRFDPPLTSPQFLRYQALPLLSVAGVLGTLAGLLGWRARDRRRFARAWNAAWWLALGGSALSLCAVVGFAALGPTGRSANVIGTLLAALLLLAGGCLLALGTLALGAVTLWRGRGADRVHAGLFLAAPVIGVAGAALLSDATWGWVAVLAFAAAWVALGVDLWRAPERRTPGEGREAEGDPPRPGRGEDL